MRETRRASSKQRGIESENKNGKRGAEMCINEEHTGRAKHAASTEVLSRSIIWLGILERCRTRSGEVDDSKGDRERHVEKTAHGECTSLRVGKKNVFTLAGYREMCWRTKAQYAYTRCRGTRAKFIPCATAASHAPKPMSTSASA